MAELLEFTANAMLALLAIGLVAVLGFVALWAPWWIAVPAAAALVAAWVVQCRASVTRS